MDPAEKTSCVVAESLVVPRLNRIEQSLGAGQDKFLDHDLRMRALSLVHDEHHRRISMLESWMAEQQAGTRASRAVVES
ncbi:MAG: hypothetical protein EOM91_21030, partial [Sphingobacteriia bacterium]|nr:hypothetical protein [Sphingobacteriia bacterium]